MPSSSWRIDGVILNVHKCNCHGLFNVFRHCFSVSKNIFLLSPRLSGWFENSVQVLYGLSSLLFARYHLRTFSEKVRNKCLDKSANELELQYEKCFLKHHSFPPLSILSLENRKDLRRIEENVHGIINITTDLSLGI